MRRFNKTVFKISVILLISIFFLNVNVSATCLDYNDETSCKTADGYSCVWVEDTTSSNGGYCNVDELQFVACGDAKDIPHEAPALISFAINLLKIVTPIILIVVSIISLVKAMASSKDDEMKKAQTGLIKKAIAAAMVFFLTSIVQFTMGKVAENAEYFSITACMDCFLNNSCSSVKYYRTYIGDQYYCTTIKDGSQFACGDMGYQSDYYVVTEYYEGPKNTECVEEFGYATNGFQTLGVKYNGTCYAVESTGKKYYNPTVNLQGEEKVAIQTMYYIDIDGNFLYSEGTDHCYYWEGRDNKYKEINCNAYKIETDYYIGPIAPAGSEGYAQSILDYDGQPYVPIQIKIGNEFFSKENTSEKITVYTETRDGEKRVSKQRIYAISPTNNSEAQYFYWEGRANQYLLIPDYDGYGEWYATKYFIGRKNTQGTTYADYIDGEEGYQPVAAELGYENTGKKLILWTETLYGVEEYRKMSIYKAYNEEEKIYEYYYWEGRENKYKNLNILSQELGGDLTITENVDRYAATKYYVGPANTLCGETDDDFSSTSYYQPLKVYVDGACYTKKSTGEKVLVNTTTLNGENVAAEQNIYKTPNDNKCYYWNGKINQYVNIDCSAKSVDANSVSGQPLYQTNIIEIDGAKITLEETDKKIQVYSDSTNDANNIYKGSNEKYYFLDSVYSDKTTKYTEIVDYDPDAEYIATIYYVGKKSESCNGEYATNNYQPASIKHTNGSCYSTADKNIGKKVIVRTNTRSSQYNSVYLALYQIGEEDNYEYYYWEGRENKYKNLKELYEKYSIEASEIKFKKVIDNIKSENADWYFLITDYYVGVRHYYCKEDGEDSFGSNYYQPKKIYIDNACHEKEYYTDIKVVTEKLNGERVIGDQNVYKIKDNAEYSAACYYWNGRKNSYELVSCTAIEVNAAQ